MKCTNCGEKIIKKNNICKNCKIYLNHEKNFIKKDSNNSFDEVSIYFIVKYLLVHIFKFLIISIILVIIAFIIIKKFTGS